MGYDARNPMEWQREFVEVLDGQLLHRLKPDTGDIVSLTRFANWCTLTWTASPMYQLRPDGSLTLMPVATVSTILGYALLEMLIRKLWQGRAGPSSMDKLLRKFENACCIRDVAQSLQFLNDRMKYQEPDKKMDLYARLKKGRDLLLHGNVLRQTEPEGHLLVLLIDLIVLYIMRDALQANPEH
jgi:hypothetical protein